MSKSNIMDVIERIIEKEESLNLSFVTKDDLGLIEKIANNGDGHAAYALATIYSVGNKDIAINPEQAMIWLLESGSRGVVEAMLQLAYLSYSSWLESHNDEYKERCLYWLKQSIDAGCYEGLILKGIFLEDEEKYEEAYAVYFEGAGHGRVDCMVRMAQLIDRGLIKNKTQKDSIMLWVKAAELGEQFARFALALKYFDGMCVDKNPDKGLQLLQELIEEGYPDAEAQLGALYCAGDFVEKDFAKALELFKKAAEFDQPLAFMHLGNYYADGIIVKKDVKKAIEYYERSVSLGFLPCFKHYAAVLLDNNMEDKKAYILASFGYEGGDIVAALVLAKMYHEGRGVKRDLKKAIELYEEYGDYTGDMYVYVTAASICTKHEWFKKGFELYKKAVDSGCNEAKFDLGVYYFLGRGVKHNVRLALKLWKEAADCGDTAAQVMCGEGYSDGQFGFEQDFDLANKYLSLAIKSGNAKAMCSLGELYLKEDYKGCNYKKAKRYAELAIKNGYAGGYGILGCIYFEGLEVKPDSNKAVNYFEKCDMDDLNGNLRMLHDAIYANVNVANFSKKLLSMVRYFIDCTHSPKEICLAGELCLIKDAEYYNPNRAFKYIHKAAKCKFVRAYGILAKLYQKGIGVKQDVDKYKYWLEKGAKAGDSIALASMGLRYFLGDIYTQNTKKAFDYWRKGVEKGFEECAIFMGIALFCDANNRIKGIKMLEDAFNKGNVRAGGALHLCYKRNGDFKAASRYKSAVKQMQKDADRYQCLGIQMLNCILDAMMLVYSQIE